MTNAEYVKCQKQKKHLVLQTVNDLVSQSKSTVSNLVLDEIRSRLIIGEHLEIKIISGGLTNYSYKLWLSGKHNLALYAKLSFEHAFWNPDKSRVYDLARTENEYKMMKMFSKLRPDMVATPLFCEDLLEKNDNEDKDERMKLMVTEWCENDEQVANQFIDGIIDERLVSKIAEATAILHCQDFDPSFNDDVREFMLTAFKPFREALVRDSASPLDRSTKSTRTEKLCYEIGIDELLRIVDRLEQNYRERECLIHNDIQVFNLIVEPKPSISSMDHFGKKGSVTLVDWEMAIAGPAGRDHGQLYGFPLACSIMHALNGNQDLALNSSDFLDQFWDIYAKKMMSNGKGSTQFLTKTYRDALAYAGWLMYVGYYAFRVHLDHLPIHDASPDEFEYVRDAIGIIGITLMREAFGDEANEREASLEGLIDFFRRLIQTEIDCALLLHRGRRIGRRASTLRTTGRRVSDAALNFPDAAITRLSISTSSRGYNSGRPSVVLREILLEEGDDDYEELTQVP